jgi:hypothetical protein
MNGTTGTPDCAYTLRADGIHEFQFLASSKAAIDDFFQILEDILLAAPHTDTLRYLVDITGGDREVSLVAMTQRFRRLETQLQHRARGRTAILHKPNLLIRFADEFIRALAPSRDVTRFFPIEKRDEAIAWLLSE